MQDWSIRSAASINTYLRFGKRRLQKFRIGGIPKEDLSESDARAIDSKQNSNMDQGQNL